MTLQTTLQWTPWQPLYEAWKGSKIPAEPGLYRIKRAGASGLDYVGQTGTGTMNLKKRLGMLKGAWGDSMPYRDLIRSVPPCGRSSIETDAPLK